MILTFALAFIYHSSGGKWWHKNDNDTKEHITVRYNRRANRVHIYRDGSVNVSPQKPGKARVGRDASLEAAGLQAEIGVDDYDTVPEISDEEWDD